MSPRSFTFVGPKMLARLRSLLLVAAVFCAICFFSAHHERVIEGTRDATTFSVGAIASSPWLSYERVHWSSRGSAGFSSDLSVRPFAASSALGVLALAMLFCRRRLALRRA